MVKKVIIGLVAVVILGVVAFLIVNGSGSSEESTNVSDSTSESLVVVKACDLLTEVEAQQLLGAAADGDNDSEPSATDDITVDSCGYSNNASAVADIRSIGVMVRSATTDDGLVSNKEAFEPGGAANPDGAIAVEGYGQTAYWDPATFQLAILNGNQWIGITYGTITGSDNTLEDAKKVADLVLN